MQQDSQDGTVRHIDYRALFSFTRIFRSFGMAVHPGKLLLAVMMIAVLFLCGLMLDAILGGRVIPKEFDTYRQQTAAGQDFVEWRDEQFDNIGEKVWAGFPFRGIDFEKEQIEQIKESAHPWTLLRSATAERLDERRDEVNEDFNEAAEDADEEELAELEAARDERLADIDDAEDRAMDWIDAAEPHGVFATLVTEKLDLFRNLMLASIRFDIGLDEIRLTGPADETTVIGCLRTMLIKLPAWLWSAHKLFLIIYLVIALLVWSFVGGVLSRMSVVEAARQERVPIGEAIGFVCKRWPNYIMAPLLPVIFVAVAAILLAIGGLMFNVWALDIIAGLIFGLALLVGFVMALLLIGYVGAVNMLYPALSAEATDFFDAVGRCYSYVFSRPWRFILYCLVTLVYGAATYIFIGLVVFLTLSVTQQAAGVLVFSHGTEPVTEDMEYRTDDGEAEMRTEVVDPGTPLFDDILPPPQFGSLEYRPNFDNLSFTEDITAVAVMVWVYLLIATVGAYAVSFYMSAFSQVYLLMRKRCDGTDYSEVFFDPHPRTPAPADKVEPESEAKPAPDDASAEDDGEDVAAQATTVAAPVESPAPESTEIDDATKQKIADVQEDDVDNAAAATDEVAPEPSGEDQDESAEETESDASDESDDAEAEEEDKASAEEDEPDASEEDAEPGEDEGEDEDKDEDEEDEKKND